MDDDSPPHEPSSNNNNGDDGVNDAPSGEQGDTSTGPAPDTTTITTATTTGSTPRGGGGGPPLLGELARATAAANNPAAQAARRTFATSPSGSGSAVGQRISRHHHHHHAAAAADGHQTQLRQQATATATAAATAAATVGPAPVAAVGSANTSAGGGGHISTISAAAAATSLSSLTLGAAGMVGTAQQQQQQHPPPRSPPRRAASASAVAAGAVSGGGSTSAPSSGGAGGATSATITAATSTESETAAAAAVATPPHHRSASAVEASPSTRGIGAMAGSSGSMSMYQNLRTRLDGGVGGAADDATLSDSPGEAGVGAVGGIGGDVNNNSPSARSRKGWSNVEVATGAAGGIPPCQRSLHAAAALNGSVYVFGGYDGQSRLNDFHCFNFADARWSPVLPGANSGPPPSPRDRHVALVHGTAFYVFGGFDGTSRVSDFYGFDFSSMMWRQVQPLVGSPPSPRHSHSAVVYQDCAYVYGGYDGSYRSDFHQFDFTSRTWSAVTATGRSPRARYRATTVVHCNTMVLFGGHDGTRHLADAHTFDFDTGVWSAVLTEGTPPIPRDSHVSVVHFDSMYVFGGSTGSAMNDLMELKLPTSAHPVAKWRTIDTPPSGTAGHRFCHVAVEYEDSMYVFGGYDGTNRLNDFIRFDFDVDDLSCVIPPSTLVTDLKSLVNDEALSDVTFIVEDQPVYAHKILLMRCPYFQAMLLGSMMESSQSEIRMEQVSHSIFLLLLEYLYTDNVRIPLDAAMDLFAAANQFSLPRLQAMCEKKMLESITIRSAATIFLAADIHSAENLRSKSLKYILAHFEQVSKTDAFEEMARGNVELVFEILRNR
mmetsp:Transcript_542/g.1286  ORF Transcript_542/g.1286 Transcript_542/m.1286 type:complete len:829 (-) Transcript_542:59-2545(-)